MCVDREVEIGEKGRWSIASQSAIALDMETSDKTPFNKIHMVITFVFLVALYFCRCIISNHLFFWLSGFFPSFRFVFFFFQILLMVPFLTRLLLLSFPFSFWSTFDLFPCFLLRHTAIGRNSYYCFRIVLHSVCVCVVLTDFNKEFFCIKRHHRWCRHALSLSDGIVWAPPIHFWIWRTLLCWIGLLAYHSIGVSARALAIVTPHPNGHFNFCERFSL